MNIGSSTPRPAPLSQPEPAKSHFIPQAPPNSPNALGLFPQPGFDPQDASYCQGQTGQQHPLGATAYSATQAPCWGAPPPAQSFQSCAPASAAAWPAPQLSEAGGTAALADTCCLNKKRKTEDTPQSMEDNFDATDCAKKPRL